MLRNICIKLPGARVTLITVTVQVLVVAPSQKFLLCLAQDWDNKFLHPFPEFTGFSL